MDSAVLSFFDPLVQPLENGYFTQHDGSEPAPRMIMRNMNKARRAIQQMRREVSVALFNGLIREHKLEEAWSRQLGPEAMLNDMYYGFYYSLNKANETGYEQPPFLILTADKVIDSAHVVFKGEWLEGQKRIARNNMINRGIQLRKQYMLQPGGNASHPGGSSPQPASGGNA